MTEASALCLSGPIGPAFLGNFAKGTQRINDDATRSRILGDGSHEGDSSFVLGKQSLCSGRMGWKSGLLSCASGEEVLGGGGAKLGGSLKISLCSELLIRALPSLPLGQHWLCLG